MNPYAGLSKSALKKLIKAKLQRNRMQEVWEIIRYFPITALAKGVRLNYNTLSKRLLDPGQFTLKNVAAFAKYFDVQPQRIYDLFFLRGFGEIFGNAKAAVIDIKKGGGDRGKNISVA